MNAYIFSKKLFDNYMKDNGYSDSFVPSNMAVISIGEPKEPSHYFKDGTERVLNIDFWDVNDYDVEGIKGLTDKQAETIYNFIAENIGRTFYIHCRAGVSRSQAVGRFLADCYGYTVNSMSGRDIFPNNHVLSLLKRQHRYDSPMF